MAVIHADHMLERLEAPDVTPVSLSDVKAQLRFTASDEDAYLTALIAAAVAFVDGEGALGRAMIAQKWGQSMQYPAGRVYLKMTPVTELTAVKYWDADNVQQTATLSDFRLVANGTWAYVEPIDGAAWPTAFNRPDAVTLEYMAGYGETAANVPADLRHALLLLISHWYQNREASSESAVQEIPLGFEMLVNAHRVSWYG